MPLYAPSSGGGGAVSSVNGRSGVVTGLAEDTDARFPTSGEKTKLTAMPPVLLIATTGALPAGTPAGTVVVVQA
jgi:hypothetical protein